MRSLLTVVALLSIVLFGAGTAHAILGVQDDVPGQDLVWPILCVKTPSAANSLNTNWAIADVIGGTPDPNGILVVGNCTICTITSSCFPDFIYEWTPFDVVVDNCKDLIATRNPVEQAALTVTNDVLGNPLAGGPYYAGYIKCTQSDQATHTTSTNVRDRFMNNLYLIDAPNGFASGFNGPSNELGLTPFLGESTAAAQEITAANVYLRYFVANANANTWDWWMLLAGRNQYNTININSSRNLQCLHFCDEDENCVSLNIPIPNELNIINVASILPGAPLNTTFPKAGFAACGILETGVRNFIGGSGAFTINGTLNNAVISPSNTYYSLYGWSYQRVDANSTAGNYDVVHPMYRQYCSGSTVATSVSGAFAPDNQVNCICSGTGC
jgi:hypothetical protein